MAREICIYLLTYLLTYLLIVFWVISRYRVVAVVTKWTAISIWNIAWYLGDFDPWPRLLYRLLKDNGSDMGQPIILTQQCSALHAWCYYMVSAMYRLGIYIYIYIYIYILSQSDGRLSHSQETANSCHWWLVLKHVLSSFRNNKFDQCRQHFPDCGTVWRAAMIMYCSWAMFAFLIA